MENIENNTHIDYSDFIYEKNFNKFSICIRKHYSFGMQSFLRDPDYFLDNTSGPFLKNDHGDTTTVAIVNIGGTDMVVKRYNVKNWRHFLKKCWRKSRAFQAWQSSFYFQQNAIDTVEPIAILEKRIGFLRSTSYLVTAYVKAHCGSEYFGPQAKPTIQWQSVISEIIKMMKNLRKARVRHHDFQYGNILITDDARVLLVDLDHVKIYNNEGYFFLRAFKKDIDHFFAFLTPNPKAKEMFEIAFKNAMNASHN